MSNALTPEACSEPDEAGPSAGFRPSRWVSAAEFARLRVHPKLPGAVAAFTAALIETYQGNILLNAVLCDRGRVMIGLFVLYLDVLPLPGTGARGATLGAVQALCLRTGVCSAGRANSMLAAIRFGGFIVPQRDPLDQRRRLLVPTPKLLAAQHERWALQFDAMSSLFAGAALVPARLQAAPYRTAFLRQLGEHFLAGFRLLDHVPILNELAESNAGLLILGSLVIRHLAGECLPGEPVPVSISALARHFCVSRAHVRNMLARAERAGLLVQVRGSEHVVPRPALAEAILQFFGVLFITMNHAAAAARRETEA